MYVVDFAGWRNTALNQHAAISRCGIMASSVDKTGTFAGLRREVNTKQAKN